MGTRRMDINSLLSPSESNGSAAGAPPSSLSAVPPPSSLDAPPESRATSAADRPVKPAKAKGKSLAQQAASSPRNIARNNSHPVLPPNALLQTRSITSSPLVASAAQQSLKSAPVTPLQQPVGSPLLVGAATPTSQPYHPHALQRIPSTERMDFLADVAMQQQPSQPNNHHNNIGGFRGSAPHELSGNPSVPSSPSTARKSSLISSTGEILPTPTVQPRYNLSAASLSMPDIQTIVGLLKELQEDSYNSDKHVDLIALLRRGLNTHINPEEGEDVTNDPTSYELISELRQAREAMDTRFPLGEERWIEWIQDECMLARTADEKAGVLELCKKAVEEEAGSSKLWRLYGDWVTILYQKAHGINDLYPNNLLEQHPVVGPILARRDLTEEEKAIGQERFSREVMLTVWAQGVMATQWHVNDSNLVWDPYISILINQMPIKPPMAHVQSMQDFFTDRLKQPHMTSDQTFAMFNEFVSQYAPDSYEARMVAATKLHSSAKHQLAKRQEREFHLQRAIESGEVENEWVIWRDYLAFEKQMQEEEDPPSYALKLYLALFERANLRFPSSIELWEEHYGLIRMRRNDLKAASVDVCKEVLAVTKRAVRHCPWSGSLWSYRLFALESYGKDFESIEEEKHQATSKGLLENVGGMDELIKAYSAWCGFLRRRAFAPGAGEDEQDFAEVGIRSAIESVRTVGESKYGKEFRGDPLFRIERIYHKFLSQSQRPDEARLSWSKLAEVHGNQMAFWDRYYLWEMTTWGRVTGTGTQPATAKNLASPEIATAVLQRAVLQPQLDWPEKAIEMYLHHCAQHENIEKIQDAHVECDKVMKDVAIRRKQEAEEAAAAQAQAQEDATSQTKRKREESPTSYDNAKKRVRSTEEQDEEMRSARDSASTAPEVKRSRENATVVVGNLPPGTSEKRVRQFFRDCGDILSVSLVETQEEGNDKLTATLEFETREDLLSALTKNNKTLDGNQIEVFDGSSTSVFVSNYPPDWGKEEIVDLFKDYGEIVEVRFPSLRHGVTRRFCYVQYVKYEEAKAAEALDNRVLGKFNLNVKLSAPQDKKSREGAQEEGREIFVINLPFEAIQTEIRRHFAKAGKVRNVRLKRGLDGKHQGRAWIIYDKEEEAQTAVRDLHDSRFQGRNLTVTSSKHRAPKRILKGHIGDTTDASPFSQPMDTSGSPAHSDEHSETLVGQGPPQHRTIIVRNIPDTIHQEQVEKKLAPFGTIIKSVRRVTKDDHIVEFADPAAASAARLALDGQALWETTIHVATADGTGGEKKTPSSMVPAAVKVPRPRVGKQSTVARTQRAFPNASKTEAMATAEASGSKSDGHPNGSAGDDSVGAGDAKDTNQLTETDKPAETKPVKMSNADFRAFLS